MDVVGQVKSTVKCFGGEVKLGICCHDFEIFCIKTCSAGPMTFQQDWTDITIHYNVSWSPQLLRLVPEPNNPVLDWVFSVEQVLSGCWLTHAGPMSNFVNWCDGFRNEITTGVTKDFQDKLGTWLDANINDPLVIKKQAGYSTLVINYHPYNMSFFSNRSNILYFANITVLSHQGPKGTGKLISSVWTPAGEHHGAREPIPPYLHLKPLHYDPVGWAANLHIHVYLLVHFEASLQMHFSDATGSATGVARLDCLHTYFKCPSRQRPMHQVHYRRIIGGSKRPEFFQKTRQRVMAQPTSSLPVRELPWRPSGA